MTHYIFRQFSVGIANLLFQRGLKWCPGDEFTHHCASFGQSTKVLDIQRDNRVIDFCRQPVVVQKIPERFGGGGKTTRNPYPGLCKLADQLAKRGILAADGGDIVHS